MKHTDKFIKNVNKYFNIRPIFRYVRTYVSEYVGDRKNGKLVFYIEYLFTFCINLSVQAIYVRGVVVWRLRRSVES